MSIAIIQFLGTNCEYDTQYAFEKLGYKVNVIWHEEDYLPEDTKLVVLPGGFSYGDYLRSGALAKHASIMRAVKEFAHNGGCVLGICNGFQILCEVGLLPGALKRNKHLHFISKNTYVRVCSNENKFLSLYKEHEVLNLPVAHHDGNYYIDDATLSVLIENGQILVQYCDENGTLNDLNGSVHFIAGVSNKTKNVFGLMPHPERAVEMLLGSEDGKNMLEGLLG